ncbi:hypothetical protein DVH24_003352 [Malus domestica]|uniref:Uncharacterized protein n=1 Tax=Malus domestica TaxID=3750 RepID=A0A498IL24_MALDO|nr:hypothetical protein DVH24_003352 [Malus domestica]
MQRRYKRERQYAKVLVQSLLRSSGGATWRLGKFCINVHVVLESMLADGKLLFVHIKQGIYIFGRKIE